MQTMQKNENVLGRLQAVQHRLGYIPEMAIKEIAVSLGVPVSEVYGVASFYSFLAVAPKGRNIIRVCRSQPCHLEHAGMVVTALEKVLGIRPGQTTADARFTLEFTNCIGACDMAPAMLINDDLHGNLTADGIARVLQSYK